MRAGFENERYIISDLSTWRWIGILTASVGMIGALLSIPGYPLWSLSIFALDIMVVYGLVAYGGHRARA